MAINKITLKIPEAARSMLNNPQSFVYKALYNGLTDVAITVQRNVKKNVIPGWNMGHKTRLPYFTGNLNRSIVYQQEGFKILVGSNMVYAAIQEYGGIIKPKKAKALFIPMSKHGQIVGARKGESRLTYGEDFIFKQEVEIKPKAYFQRGMEASIDKIMSILNNVLNEMGTAAGLQ